MGEELIDSTLLHSKISPWVVLFNLSQNLQLGIRSTVHSFAIRSLLKIANFKEQT